MKSTMVKHTTHNERETYNETHKQNDKQVGSMLHDTLQISVSLFWIAALIIHDRQRGPEIELILSWISNKSNSWNFHEKGYITLYSKEFIEYSTFQALSET